MFTQLAIQFLLLKVMRHSNYQMPPTMTMKEQWTYMFRYQCVLHLLHNLANGGMQSNVNTKSGMERLASQLLATILCISLSDHVNIGFQR